MRQVALGAQEAEALGQDVQDALLEEQAGLLGLASSGSAREVVLAELVHVGELEFLGDLLAARSGSWLSSSASSMMVLLCGPVTGAGGGGACQRCVRGSARRGLRAAGLCAM